MTMRRYAFVGTIIIVGSCVWIHDWVNLSRFMCSVAGGFVLAKVTT